MIQGLLRFLGIHKKRKRRKRLWEVVESSLKVEYDKALQEYHDALYQFDNASPDYIDSAIINLNLTQEKLNNTICKLKINRNIEPSTMKTGFDVFEL